MMRTKLVESPMLMVNSPNPARNTINTLATKNKFKKHEIIGARSLSILLPASGKCSLWVIDTNQ